MNKQFFFGVLLCLAIVSVFAFRPAGGQKWEYDHIILAGKKNVAEILNEAGNQGWELVSVDASTAYFKRPLE